MSFSAAFALALSLSLAAKPVAKQYKGPLDQVDVTGQSAGVLVKFEAADRASAEKALSQVSSAMRLDDAMRVRIAALACLPVLNLGLDCYAGFVAVVVYPDEFVIRDRETEDEDGVVHTEDAVLTGEAWEHGPVILSWQDIEASGQGAGYNVVAHEFAHKLDMQSGEANGVPPLHSGMRVADFDVTGKRPDTEVLHHIFAADVTDTWARHVLPPGSPFPARRDQRTASGVLRATADCRLVTRRTRQSPREFCSGGRMAPIETRLAAPADAKAILAAHLDSIHSIGPHFYSPGIVESWSMGLTPDVYVKAMEGGEVFFIAVGSIDGEPAVLGFASHRVDDDQDGVSVYIRGRASRCGTRSASEAAERIRRSMSASTTMSSAIVVLPE